MQKIFLGFILLVSALPSHAADWKQHLASAMPLLGHRNWILVVDSAYPLQTSPGIETVETNASQLEVVKAVLDEIDHSIQVRPVILMDAELPFISDAEAPGVAQYRVKVEELLKGLLLWMVVELHQEIENLL